MKVEIKAEMEMKIEVGGGDESGGKGGEERWS